VGEGGRGRSCRSSSVGGLHLLRRDEGERP
jgi:hypothetical protein